MLRGKRARRLCYDVVMTRVDSRVLINTGDGKGKSSAAFGVMTRSWARGWKIVVIQFIKGGKYKTGERKLADHLKIEWHTMGDGFTWESKDLAKTEELGVLAWQTAKEKLTSDYNLVILDELTYICKFGWVKPDEVAESITARYPKTNVIITGRNAPRELIDIADTVTEMKKIKHAFDNEIPAMKGIEF